MTTDLTTGRPAAPAVRQALDRAAGALRRQRPVERACYLIGAALVLSGVLHLAVDAVDPRPWYGPLSWRKPVTFGVSFGTVLASITWVSSYLRLPERTRTWVLGVFAADCIVEVAGITVQAWRHVPSHFNTETPFDQAIAMSLAFGGGVLFITLGRLAVAAITGRSDAAPAMRLALRAGFWLLIAGLLSGAAMIARGETLIKQGKRGLAYDTAGFLKWFHGITLHGVLVLPALAWWLAHRNATEQTQRRGVLAGIACYVLASAVALAVCLVRL